MELLNNSVINVILINIFYYIIKILTKNKNFFYFYNKLRLQIFYTFLH